MQGPAPAPHPIRGDELRAVLEETASVTARETADVLNARGLLTPYGKWWDTILVSVWRRRFEIKSAVQCDGEATPALDAPPPDRKHKHRRTSRGKRA
jgi:hypothetical protein